MEGRRVWTHNENTADGKTFMAFIACVVRSYLLNCLSEYLDAHSTSLKKVFNQLSNVTIVSSNGQRCFVKALTKTQKDILSAFDAADDILTSI